MMVNTLSISMKAPARNMSCARRAPRSSGPAVGRLRTMATMSPPESSCGRDQPTVLMKGLKG